MINSSLSLPLSPSPPHLCLGDYVDDPPGDYIHRHVRYFDPTVRSPVKRKTLPEEGSQRLSCCEKGPRRISCASGVKQFQGCMQPDAQPCTFNDRLVIVRTEGATTQCNDGCAHSARFSQFLPLDVAKVSFAVQPEYLADGSAFPFFDPIVQVNERPVQKFSQSPADAGFTRSHESDEINDRGLRQHATPICPRNRGVAAALLLPSGPGAACGREIL